MIKNKTKTRLQWLRRKGQKVEVGRRNEGWTEGKRGSSPARMWLIYTSDGGGQGGEEGTRHSPGEGHGAAALARGL